MNDLTELLARWKPPVLESTSFRRDVWHRIAAAEAQKNSGFLAWLGSLPLTLARPRVALAAACVAILLGGVIGGTLSASGNSGEIAYLRSINPYALAHALL